MKAIYDLYAPRFCANCGQPLNLAGWALDDYQAGNVLTCACGLQFEKMRPAPVVHYWPGPQASVTACGVDLYAHAGRRSGAVVCTDPQRVTCGNCRRTMAAL